MANYRWNVSQFAEGYDAAAQHIHPHYLEVQDVVLDQLSLLERDDFLVVDAGGGSGRLVQRILERYRGARAVIVDQSEAFLALAERRLVPFGERSSCHVTRLQDDWFDSLAESPAAVVSMTAIHHLDAGEKQSLFQRIHDALLPGGLFINGDEVRPASDVAYLEILKNCAEHKHQLMNHGMVPNSMHEILRAWEQRNVDLFDVPRVSGDDCHETIETQLSWLQTCGFERAICPWQRELWAVMIAVKSW
jgi:SAM-dependent methyltransferase